MNLNNTNNFTTFGKSIKVKEAQRDSSFYAEYAYTEQRLVQVLNDEKCYEYSDSEKAQIKEFFADILDGDKVVFKHCDEAKYILSGKEAKDIEALNKFGNDARALKLPENNHRHGGGYNTSDAEMKDILETFKKEVSKYLYPKCNSLVKDAFRFDKNQTTIEIVNDNPLSAKAEAIIATTKTENGTTTKRIDFSA
jgi:hypothetical protein